MNEHFSINYFVEVTGETEKSTSPATHSIKPLSSGFIISYSISFFEL